MHIEQKVMRVGIIFLALLLLGGTVLVFAGRDAVTLALEKKEGILSAEQVKIAFENIGGRLVNEAVIESQQVQKDDVLMVLDSTDVDLSIERLKAQIQQAEAQISELNGSIEIGLAKASTSEAQSYRQIEQQKKALDAAKATYDNQLLTYNRRKALIASGAIAQAELDSARMELDVADANVGQQHRLLDKMLTGTSEAARARVLTSGNAGGIELPDIVHQRQELENSRAGVQALVQQKENLAVQLKELLVKKERLTLRAPEDGKVLKILAKQGEMVSANAPVVLLESRRCYYDIYLDERQVAGLKPGAAISGNVVVTQLPVKGIIRFITAAPGFADLKMSREKGQGDLTAFQVRIYVEPQDDLLPGMTIGVDKDAFFTR